jgi:hypothetical protein
MSQWMRIHFTGYDPDQAPAILMSTESHTATFGVYNRWRARMKQSMGGVFDWKKVTEADMMNLSEEMFDAAVRIVANAAGLLGLVRAYEEQAESVMIERRDESELLTVRDLLERYRLLEYEPAVARLDATRVPERLRHLIPYAQIWGVADDTLREILVRQAKRRCRI